MSGEVFYLSGGMWRRHGHPSVPPGAKETDPAPPSVLRKLQIGRLSLSSTATTPTPVPDPTPTPTPTPSTTTFNVGVDQISTLETGAGVNVGYHRTYFSASSTGGLSGLISQAAADKAAGRIPVTSFKIPMNTGDTITTAWSRTASGFYDAGFKAAVAQLVALDYPVIVACHHEPDGDGDLATYKAMTAHLVPIFSTAKVQFWQCFTGYNQLFGSSVWKLADVYVPGVDGMGFDPYQSYLAGGGGTTTTWTDHISSYYTPFSNFAKAKGIQWGIWETGLNEQAAASGNAKTLTWMRDYALGAKNLGASHWVYFNSETTLDGFHNWKLTTTAPANKRAQFIAEMQRYAT